MKIIISFVLCLILMLTVFPATVFAEEEQSLEDIIRPQIEAFAKSIDQPNADKEAADAIATHGMFGRGKDLKIGKDHALTATIMNAELTKELFTSAVVDLIKTADEMNMKEIYSIGGCDWKINAKNSYFFWIYEYDAEIIIKNGNVIWPDDFLKRNDFLFSGENGYDDSLEWMTGKISLDLTISIAEVRLDKIIYKADVVFLDIFDFTTSTGSGFGDLISGIGALLFKEFTWYSTFDFQIEIPNNCEHSFGEWKTAAKPNCTEKGREERTCKNCGCIETKSTAATGHYFGEWFESKTPTYFEEGEERRDCSNCDYSEIRTIATLEYLLGDLNGDEKINVLDANLIRRYAAKLIELDENLAKAADVSGDGKVNILDANLIRRYAAKLIDSFPVTE